MSDTSFPCPVCHLSFKTEAKVSQHLDKCLASQEERPSRKTFRSKRLAEGEAARYEEIGEASAINESAKRVKKEDQVAAWSGLGLRSPRAKTAKAVGKSRSLSRGSKTKQKLKRDKENFLEDDEDDAPYEVEVKDAGINASLAFDWSESEEEAHEKKSQADETAVPSRGQAVEKPESEELRSDSENFKSASRRKGRKGSNSSVTQERKSESTMRKTADALKENSLPLAQILRPQTMDKLFGQDSAVGENKVSQCRKADIAWLKALVTSKAPLPSIIFWGPPGCGKTTIAKIIAKAYAGDKKSPYRFVSLSACQVGVAEVKRQSEVARNELKMFKRRTLLFMDEIHRFAKNQQDAFLPIVEDGTIVLFGATTENPSFSLNSALLSRSRVVALDALSTENVTKILERGAEYLRLKILRESGEKVNDEGSVAIEENALNALAGFSGGDARVALNSLQTAVRIFLTSPLNSATCIDADLIKQSLQKSHYAYDRDGDQHYQMISAFHKSIRGSDDSAALYWLTRMLKGGEDPRYIARRLIRIASEDIGLGDPQALIQATAAHQAVMAVGMPECDVILAQVTVYLARARKSVEVYRAMNASFAEIERQAGEGALPPVPLHLRNASTKMMREMGYGKGYSYNPDCSKGEDEKQTYLPEGFETLDFFD